MKDGLLLSDIAFIPSSDDSVEPHFITLWSKPASADEQRRVLLDATAVEFNSAKTRLAQQGFMAQNSITVRTDSRGQRRYSAVWSNQGAPSELRLEYAGFELVEQPQWDVAVAPAEKLPDPEEPPTSYAALWRADEEFESTLLTAVPVESVLDQLRPLLAVGYRPFSIAVDSTFSSLTPTPTAWAPRDGRDPAAPENSDHADGVEAKRGSPLCSLVLHRPLIPDAAKESLALRQAAAATALLRLNAAKGVWPLFQDQPDPRLRSYVQHRLAMFGVDPQSLFMQMKQETDASRQRALIQGIGEFARTRLLSRELRAAVTADLAKRYADDPDPGIHGAAEWALRQLGADATITEVKVAYSTGAAVGNRRWYLTKIGPQPSATSGMTLSIIHAKEEFLMGSPVSEVDRTQGPTGKNEIRHRRHIGRRFAIGMHEITVAQFRAFRSEHQFDRKKSRDEDSPANMISWYDAAAYCNWLSKEEGIPPEQWCYDPDHEFADGMPLVADYLQRTGYRLPSEAEWEYACRAGTITARYFGETETLLGEYGCYTKTSGDKWMHSVGTLRPNAAGLFDMHGNVLEWCQDALLLYPTDIAKMGDREQTGTLSDSERRVLRGGSFIDRAADVRSAIRNDLQPFVGYYGIGFRVARTYP
jgi:formylglycine-generating enzyme required for sulfatase activity